MLNTSKVARGNVTRRSKSLSFIKSLNKQQIWNPTAKSQLYLVRLRPKQLLTTGIPSSL